jgi:hypothetical protein
MEFSNRINETFLSLLFFMLAGDGFCANLQAKLPKGDIRGCGDYTILQNPSDREVLEHHCGTANNEDFDAMRNLVTRLNPAEEARAAAQRGDFRLAATTGGGPPNPYHKHNWYLMGVECENIDDKDVVIWLRRSDALTETLDRYQGSMDTFARRYNAEMISDKSFPKNMGCVLN